MTGPGAERDLVRLTDELSRAGSTMPAGAIEGLIAAGAAAVPPLIDLLETTEPDSDDWTPLWAVVALGELRDARAIKPLLGILRLPEGDVLSEAAAAALARIGEPAVPALAAFTREAASWEARHYAYAALGLIRSDGSLSALITSLDRDPILWSTIAMALADLGDARALPALRALLPRCDEREAPAVREALDILEGRHPPYPRSDSRDWRERYAEVAGDGRTGAGE